MPSAPAGRETPPPRATWSPPGGRRRRPRRGAGVLRSLLVATVAFACVLALGVAGVVALAHRLDRPAPPPTGCWASVDGTSWALDAEQADNAATIAAVTVRRGLPAHAATVALATAQQESKLRNIDYGDRDSLGLFQQRPSQGWGSKEQVLDPVHATNAFLDALVKVPDWQDLDVTVAAQKVQRSAFPDAYGNHEAAARAWASGLTGETAAGVTCTWLGDPAGGHTVGDLADRLARDYGDLGPAADTAAGTLTVDARPLGSGAAGDARAAWSVASWAVAVGDDQDVVRVDVAGQSWVRGTAGWQPSSDVGEDRGGAATDPGAGRVRITVAP